MIINSQSTLLENPGAKLASLVFRNMKTVLKNIRNSFFILIILAHCFVISACLGSSIKRKTERKESEEVKENFLKRTHRTLYSFPKISI